MKKRAFAVTIARKMTSPGNYKPSHAIVATPEGVFVVSLGASEQHVEALTRDANALLASMRASKDVLAYLYDRNSTITAYSKPTTLVADSPEAAALKLLTREERVT